MFQNVHLIADPFEDFLRRLEAKQRVLESEATWTHLGIWLRRSRYIEGSHDSFHLSGLPDPLHLCR
jgi:hypothetical protein